MSNLPIQSHKIFKHIKTLISQAESFSIQLIVKEMRHISNFRSLRLRLIETGEILYLNSNFKINIFIYRKDTSSLVMHKEYIKR